MKITIIAVGKENDFAGLDLVNEYNERISHYFPIEWKYISSSDQQQENSKIIKLLEKENFAFIITLDEKGKEYDSKDFSKQINNCMNNSVKNLIFIIGGSYGLNDLVKKKSNTVISLSKLTFPHQLVRLILAEQIYRGCTIIKGEKYHHS